MVNYDMLLLHQTKHWTISCVVQVIVIVSSYGCLMDTYCKCIVRLNDFLVRFFSFFSSLSFFLYRLLFFSLSSLSSCCSSSLWFIFLTFPKFGKSVWTKDKWCRTIGNNDDRPSVNRYHWKNHYKQKNPKSILELRMQIFLLKLTHCASSKKKGRHDKRMQSDHRSNRTKSEHKMHWSMPNLIEFSDEMGLSMANRRCWMPSNKWLHRLTKCSATQF